MISCLTSLPSLFNSRQTEVGHFQFGGLFNNRFAFCWSFSTLLREFGKGSFLMVWNISFSNFLHIKLSNTFLFVVTHAFALSAGK